MDRLQSCYPVRSIRRKGPFPERFMRLKFQNGIPKLKKERIISKLVGCIHRRLDQKQVLWNNAKYIPLQYNEQRGNILLFPTKGKRAGNMKDKDLSVAWVSSSQY